MGEYNILGFDLSTIDISLGPAFNWDDMYIVNDWNEEHITTLDEDDYTYDKDSGKLTLEYDVYQDLKDEMSDERREVTNEYKVFICFEFRVGKYVSIDDVDEIAPEDAEQIAVMQSIQSDVLTYFSQFQLGVSSQEKLNDIAYTIAVTVISTGVTMATQGAKEMLKSVVNECFEEVFTDSIMESIVGGIARSYAADAYQEMMATTIAESLRESKSAYKQMKQTRQNKIKMKGLKKAGFSSKDIKTMAKAITSEKRGYTETNKDGTEKIVMKSPRKMYEKAVKGLKNNLRSMTMEDASLVLGQKSQTIFEFATGKLSFADLKVNAIVGKDVADATRLDNMLDRLKPNDKTSQVKLYSILMFEQKSLPSFAKFADSQKPVARVEMVKNMGDWLKQQGENIYTDENGVRRAEDPHTQAMRILIKRGFNVEQNVYMGGKEAMKIDDFTNDKDDSNEDSSSIDETRPNEQGTVWFERDGKRIINMVIDGKLDLSTELGRETKKAIENLMHQLEQEKRFKLYNPTQDEDNRYDSFGDTGFEDALAKLELNPNSVGGVLYLIDIMGSYYVGLTERTFEVRFEEHITGAVRGYVITGGDINLRGFHKHYAKICEALESIQIDINGLHRELQTYSAIGAAKLKKTKLEEIYDKIKPLIKTHVIEIHYGTKLLGSRESQFIEKFPYKALFEEGFLELGEHDTEIDYMALRTNSRGLNTAAGGAGISGAVLPLYDIAIMLALGYSSKKISEILQDPNNYGLFAGTSKDQFKKTIQHKTEDIFGGAYKAQEELLKPIIEHLDSIEGISRHDIYMAFKNAELMQAWFNEWAEGREFLKGDVDKIFKIFNLDQKTSWETIERLLNEREKHIAGISESQWLELYSHSDRIGKFIRDENSVLNKVQIGQKKVYRVLHMLKLKLGFSTLEDLKSSLLKERVEEILKNGYIIDPDSGKKTVLKEKDFYEIICEKLDGFNPSGKYFRSPKAYFEMLFNGLSVDKIWNRHYKEGTNNVL